MVQDSGEVNVITLWPTQLYVSKFNTDFELLITEIYRLASVGPTDIKKSNYGGWQSDVHLYNNPVFKPICEHIARTCFGLFLKSNITVRQMWAGINRPGDQNLVHSHGNIYNVSGIFYVKVPANSGEIVFRDPRPGSLNAPNHNKLFSKGGEYKFMPSQGTMLLVPSYLEHFVLPNRSDEDRICVAFDITIED